MTPHSSKWKTLLLLSYGVWVFTVPAHGQLDTQRVEKARRAWQVTTAVPDSIWKTFPDSLWQDTSYQVALLRTLPPLDSLPYSERSMLYSRMGKWYATARRTAIRQALANVFIHGSGDYEVCWENMYVLSENGQEGDFSPAGLDTLLRIMRTPKFRSLPLYPLINRITWPAGVAFVDSIFRHAPTVDAGYSSSPRVDPQFYSRRWRAARELARQGHREALAYMLARAEEAFSKPDRQYLLSLVSG
ncbi:MAG: hypothetical protein H6555_06655 [Lewinellaceae bacterium]|nr:hypothetical protein [Lewinellaceae bacterium]